MGNGGQWLEVDTKESRAYIYIGPIEVSDCRDATHPTYAMYGNCRCEWRNYMVAGPPAQLLRSASGLSKASRTLIYGLEKATRSTKILRSVNS